MLQVLWGSWLWKNLEKTPSPKCTFTVRVNLQQYDAATVGGTAAAAVASQLPLQQILWSSQRNLHQGFVAEVTVGTKVLMKCAPSVEDETSSSGVGIRQP